jgi:uncharacterized protein with HEPN domain
MREASNRLSPDFKLQHNSIPWEEIIGLRNRFIHEYFGIDLEIIYQIVQDELPSLKSSIQALLNIPNS